MWRGFGGFSEKRAKNAWGVRFVKAERIGRMRAQSRLNTGRPPPSTWPQDKSAILAPLAFLAPSRGPRRLVQASEPHSARAV